MTTAEIPVGKVEHAGLLVGDPVRYVGQAANPDYARILGVGTVKRFTRTRVIVRWGGIGRLRAHPPRQLLLERAGIAV